MEVLERLLSETYKDYSHAGKECKKQHQVLREAQCYISELEDEFKTIIE